MSDLGVIVKEGSYLNGFRVHITGLEASPDRIDKPSSTPQNLFGAFQNDGISCEERGNDG
jgi:hypothetical protein